MSIFGRQSLMVFQFTGGFAVGATLLYWIAPFWVLQVAGLVWFAFFIYRFWSLKSPHCGKSATFGPLPHRLLRPRCPNCGTSIFQRAAA